MRDSFIGLALAAFASCCFAAGTIIQAIETRQVGREHALRASLLVQLAKRGRWLAGVGLALAAAGLQLWALSLAPVALVQPADAFGFVLLLAAGARVLHEPVGLRQLAATAAILVGVLAIAFAHIEHAGTHAGAAALALALGVTALLAAAPFALRRGGHARPWLMIVGAGAAFALGAFGLRLVSDALGTGDWVAVAGFAAIAGSGSLLGLGSEMSALQVRPVAAVAPVIFALEMLIPMLLARLVGGERWPTDLHHASLLLGGVALTLGGTTALLRSGAVGVVLGAGHQADAPEGGPDPRP